MPTTEATRNIANIANEVVDKLHELAAAVDAAYSEECADATLTNRAPATTAEAFVHSLHATALNLNGSGLCDAGDFVHFVDYGQHYPDLNGPAPERTMVTLPALFWEDHRDRDLPAGDVVRSRSDRVVVEVTTRELAEIIDDAAYYAAEMRSATPALARSADRTLDVLGRLGTKTLEALAAWPGTSSSDTVADLAAGELSARTVAIADGSAQSIR